MHEGRIFNTAFVGDNDRMYHRVGAIGDAGAFAARRIVGLDSSLRYGDGDAWELVANGRVDGDLFAAAARTQRRQRPADD